LTLGTYAFEYCAYSSEIANEDGTFDFSGRSIAYIPSYDFAYCSHLKHFYWPQNCTSLGMYALRSTGLSAIAVPAGITSLGSGTFRTSAQLTSIILPNSLTSIGTYGFAGSTNLSSITSLATVAPTV
jgi:hypothetical protein